MITQLYPPAARRRASAVSAHLLSSLLAVPVALISLDLVAQVHPGERPRLEPRLSQEQLVSGTMSLEDIRLAGQRIFTTPFNHLDGRGDGPVGGDRIAAGGRPTIDGINGYGTVLRINGLDSQSCNECHVVVSNATVPPVLGIGGVGGISSSAFPKTLGIDVADSAGNGFAAMHGGRLINPPFLFGAGGVELLGKEMTADLQSLAREAWANPGQTVRLLTKGVDFGVIVVENGVLNTGGVSGVEEDLIVRPFGRKGEFATVRAFDIDALQFHLGMQPVEVVGVGVDADEDGVTDEISVGELSALHIHNVLLPRPEQEKPSQASRRGADLFADIGCADCHRPSLKTHTRWLSVSFPEEEADPAANVYQRLDLRALAGFSADGKGIEVPLFADLKRHDMGPALAESANSPLDRFFTTARLWGVADTAPYLHDGRATTLSEAILWHGGEAEVARQQFDALDDAGKVAILAFLRTLRTPGMLDTADDRKNGKKKSKDK